jgi:hypothetical protein
VADNNDNNFNGWATTYIYGGPGNDRVWGSTNGDNNVFGDTGNLDFFGGSGWDDVYNIGGIGTVTQTEYFTNTVREPFGSQYVRAAATAQPAQPVTTTTRH